MTIYTFSMISTTGYPFKEMILKEIPPIDLHLRFFDLSNCNDGGEEFDQNFELFSGLISALFEFARLLNKNFELLKFNAEQKNLNEFLDPNTKAKLIRNPFYPIEIPYDANLLINCQNERFLDPTAIETKVHIIYHNILEKKLPIGMDSELSTQEENFILRILNDSQAREKINNVKEKIENRCKNLFTELESYGLLGISITSFDFSPILNMGISTDDLFELLRDVGKIPAVKTWTWDYRRGNVGTTPRWLYVINSGVGVVVDGTFMPYYYLLICKPDSYLGEIPQKIYENLNKIIENE